MKRWQETQQQASESLERARLLLDQASKRRKRKKRRKRRLPMSSSHSLLRRARRRHLAVAMSGFAGYSSSCSVLFCCWQPQDARHHGRYFPCCEEAAPVVVAGQGVRYLGRLELKDSYVAIVAALVVFSGSGVDTGSGMCSAGLLLVLFLARCSLRLAGP